VSRECANGSKLILPAMTGNRYLNFDLFALYLLSVIRQQAGFL